MHRLHPAPSSDIQAPMELIRILHKERIPRPHNRDRSRVPHGMGVEPPRPQRREVAELEAHSSREGEADDRWPDAPGVPRVIGVGRWE